MTHMVVRIDGEIKTIIGMGSEREMRWCLNSLREHWPHRIYAIEEVKAANTGE